MCSGRAGPSCLAVPCRLSIPLARYTCQTIFRYLLGPKDPLSSLGSFQYRHPKRASRNGWEKFEDLLVEKDLISWTGSQIHCSEGGAVMGTVTTSGAPDQIVRTVTVVPTTATSQNFSQLSAFQVHSAVRPILASQRFVYATQLRWLLALSLGGRGE